MRTHLKVVYMPLGSVWPVALLLEPIDHLLDLGAVFAECFTKN
jgi:hypothetical protein